jgi:hypothetical protein
MPSEQFRGLGPPSGKISFKEIILKKYRSDPNLTVIARLARATQYYRASMMNHEALEHWILRFGGV